MKYRVRIATRAVDDLSQLQRWSIAQAGTQICDQYMVRIEARIRSLADFPSQGTQRADLGADWRTISFERRLIVAYRVVGGDVWIERVVAGARGTGAWT